MFKEPLSGPAAAKLLRRLLEEAGLVTSQHAEERMVASRMDLTDVHNVLLRGRCPVGKAFSLESGTYRYRFETPNMVVVVAFPDGGERLRVVTAFRKERGLR